VARTASLTTPSASDDQSRSRDTRPPSRASNAAAKASPPARARGNDASGSASLASVSRPTFSKNKGSTSFTRSTIAPMTSRASCGVSPALSIRCRRCSTSPETVCTIDVKAAIGMT
jgi:hypothetical protein